MFGKVRRHRRSSATALGALGVIVALTAAVAGGAQAARPGNSQNAKACQKGGWEDLARSEDYSGFSSEEECTSYAAQGGTLVNPLALCKQQLTDAGLTAPANANYILGTPGDDNFTGQMTAGNDVVCGFAGWDLIWSPAELEGDDIFLGGDGPDRVLNMSGGTYNGGADDDYVGFGGPDPDGLTGGTFNGGDGDDRVGPMSGGTFNGGAGDDHVHNMSGGTFNGGAGDDTVIGFSGGTFNGDAGCDATSGPGGTFNPGDQGDQPTTCIDG